MPFTYSCFISHRDYNDTQDLLGIFLDQLEQALNNELILYDMPVYRYTSKRQPGAYNRQIAKALCESLCMILVFTPEYFNERKPYCTREYIAMKRLLEERAEIFDSNHEKLIIPIILRGAKYIPSDIKDSVNCFFEFQDFTLSDPEICRHPKFAKTIRDIAETIGNYCFKVKHSAQLSEKFTIDCPNFKLPTDNDLEVKTFIEQASQTLSLTFPSL